MGRLRLLDASLPTSVSDVSPMVKQSLMVLGVEETLRP
jgi:hypothetical protein